MAHILSKVLTNVAPRIGRTEKERLVWVLRLTSVEEPKTSGDWENLRLYIALFIAVGGREALVSTGRKVNQPSRQETEQIFLQWKKSIEMLQQHKSVPKPGYSREWLEWDEKTGRYVEQHGYDDTWLIMAMRPLVDLIRTHGHLVKQCHAPALRGRRGQVCGNWFVADRPNQDHCSPTCRSRASTKAKRERERKAKAKPK